MEEIYKTWKNSHKTLKKHIIADILFKVIFVFQSKKFYIIYVLIEFCTGISADIIQYFNFYIILIFYLLVIL